MVDTPTTVPFRLLEEDYFEYSYQYNDSVEAYFVLNGKYFIDLGVTSHPAIKEKIRWGSQTTKL